MTGVQLVGLIALFLGVLGFVAYRLDKRDGRLLAEEQRRQREARQARVDFRNYCVAELRRQEAERATRQVVRSKDMQLAKEAQLADLEAAWSMPAAGE